MKCFIKHQNLFYNLYWIKRTKKNEVIGNFYGKYFDNILNFPVEIHFTYPSDGKVHYSLKSEKEKYYITAYHDKTKVKENSIITHVSEKTSLNHLLPQPELQLPLSDYNQPDTVFHFATIAFSVPIPVNAAILRNCKIQNEQPDENTLVINLDTLTPGTLNIMAFIASSDYPQPNLKEGKYWQIVDRTKTPIIGISAIHNGTNDGGRFCITS